MGKYLEYTDDDIIKHAAEVTSMTQLLGKLNLAKAGGNYANMKRKLQQLNLKCEHWTGMGWSKNERLKDWTDYSRGNNLKPHLIRERGHCCEKCKLSEWLDFPIPLELEHIDGDRTNNNIDNLQLLCNNCHALTPTWRRKKSVGGGTRTPMPKDGGT